MTVKFVFQPLEDVHQSNAYNNTFYMTDLIPKKMVSRSYETGISVKKQSSKPNNNTFFSEM